MLSRRSFLTAGAASALLPGRLGRLVEAASATECAPGGLSGVEHVVIVIQENRSFDHYFGSYRGVRGFDDRSGVFAQPGYPKGRHPRGHLLPFHFDTVHGDGECTSDVGHRWGVQHKVWAHGRMDGWVRAHLAEDGPVGTNTMGYLIRTDLAFYYALADAFTICDHYFCSAMGPTDPNRLHAMSATIDPGGHHGGPIVGSAGTPTGAPTLSWTTMPEQLEARGISWKVYAATDSTYQDGDNTLLFFKQYHSNATLAAKALAPTFPANFIADVEVGALPQVSWVIAPTAQLEHPPAPPVLGEVAINQLLTALVRNKKVWSKTVAFVTWDENGGLFDHVPPPVPPRGTKGERVTTATLPAEAEGFREPIGLGYRVPTLVLSPFARGGYVNSDVFDHTSLLRFVETRFGAEVPNLSTWRRATVGDLTSTIDVRDRDVSIPRLPQPSPADPRIARECVPGAVTGGLLGGPPYPVPPSHRPHQETGRARRRRGCAGAPADGGPDDTGRGTGTPDQGLATTGLGASSALIGSAALIAAAALVRRRRDGEA